MKKDMTSPKNYYQSRLEILRQQFSKQKNQLRTLSFLRLLVFLATGFSVYWFYSGFWSVVYTAVPGLIIFFYLVSKYTDFSQENNKTQKLIEINELEINVLQRKFNNLPDGSEFNEAGHEFSRDIDLFGTGSFFQYLNRTSLKEGAGKLAELLKANSIANILEKQKALKELSLQADWRQEFNARASLVRTEITTNVLLRWLQNYQLFTPVKAKIFARLFSAISMVLIFLAASGIIYDRFVLLWFFVGLGITGFYFKRINQLSEQTTRLRSTFDQYHQLMSLLENKNFESEFLINRLVPIQKGHLKSSKVLKQFSKALDALDQRNNMLFGVVANGFFLWDLYQARRIEEWITLYEKEVERWFDLISFFDAYNSLANFVFNHPGYSFPEISSDTIAIRAINASHPLLDTKKSVQNNFEITKGEFLIITGANMAGKSTFLRTVSLLIVMANVGLPVCATSVEYNPVKLITSMRTSDSLTDDESYFFSELKRLKFIVESIAKEKYFVILDEILKGTNSTDKANGSKKFIEKLVKAGITGIVATHDLSLCELEKDIASVENHYFDAEIINDELYFDYKLKKGVCKNMNASFLLKKMQIV
jgi:ABC-type multidrug transport system fused ATPase/permease subunit